MHAKRSKISSVGRATRRSGGRYKKRHIGDVTGPTLIKWFPGGDWGRLWFLRGVLVREAPFH